MSESIDPAPSAKPSDAASQGAALRGLTVAATYRTQPVSFVRRSGRMTARQQRAWLDHRDEYVLSVPRAQARTSVDPSVVLPPAQVFGRVAPFIVEIGSGQGEAIVAAAADHPETDFLAVEVYTPGLAQTIHRALRREVTNVRLLQADAVDVLAVTLPQGCADELWVFFPDPWHKTRHHKRRLVTAKFAGLAARVLRPPRDGRPGGVLRLATDWAEYAEQMIDVLDAASDLENVFGSGGVAPRFEGRVVTGFERKAEAAGRSVTDLTYRRI